MWSHAAIATQRKLRIFDACVLSKLLHSLHTAWPKTAVLSRLDAFQARCLRRILRIPHSYYSRISNATVLERAKRNKLSCLLLQRQLALFAEIARKDNAHPVRQVTFQPSSNLPKVPACSEEARQAATDLDPRHV